MNKLNNIKRYEDFVNENTESEWEKITVEDIKAVFPDISFIDGGKVDDGYSYTDTIIIHNLDTAIEILKYLDKKMYPYGIGGDYNDIIPIWDKLKKPNTTVKLALPRFHNSRYNQKISFVFDNGEEYPTVFMYDSVYTESPSIMKRISNTSWKRYGKYDYDKKF
jgi:hypothetical protein